MGNIALTNVASDKYEMLDEKIKDSLKTKLANLANGRTSAQKISYSGRVQFYRLTCGNLMAILSKNNDGWVVSDILTHNEYKNIFRN